MEELEFMTLAETHSKFVSFLEFGLAINAAVDFIKEHAHGEIVGLNYIEPIDLNVNVVKKPPYVKGTDSGDIVIVTINRVELNGSKTKYELTYKRYIIDDSRLQSMAQRKQ